MLEDFEGRGDRKSLDHLFCAILTITTVVKSLLRLRSRYLFAPHWWREEYERGCKALRRGSQAPATYRWEVHPTRGSSSSVTPICSLLTNPTEIRRPPRTKVLKPEKPPLPPRTRVGLRFPRNITCSARDHHRAHASPSRSRTRQAERV